MYVCMYVCMFSKKTNYEYLKTHILAFLTMLSAGALPGEGIEHQSPDGRVVRRVIVPDPDRQHGSVYVLCLT